jgi:hypothetical protein
VCGGRTVISPHAVRLLIPRSFGKGRGSVSRLSVLTLRWLLAAWQGNHESNWVIAPRLTGLLD